MMPYCTIWYQAERRRMDGFQARCLRRIMRIPNAYYSRISNKTVLERACLRPISERVLEQQMLTMGRIARGDLGAQVRNALLQQDSIQLTPLSGTRRVGRPRLTWRETVHKHCVQAAGRRLTPVTQAASIYPGAALNICTSEIATLQKAQ